MGVPRGTPVTLFAEASVRTALAVLPTLNARATAPATCGEAIDVPEIAAVAVLLPIHDEVMPTPGAIMSTHLPRLLKLANASLISLAATVIAAGTRAGDDLQASCLEFPAATTTITPSFIRLFTAVSIAEEARPPRLIFATALTPDA